MQQRQDIEGLLAEGKTIQIKPQGYSMYPLFVPGRDSAVVSPVGDRLFRRGDVVLYRRENSILVLHRVWKRTKDGIYLVGDNQKEIEGPLSSEQMKGVLTGIIRNGKSFSTGNLIYRFFAALWLWMRPARPVISHAVAAVKRFFRGKRRTEHRNQVEK